MQIPPALRSFFPGFVGVTLPLAIAAVPFITGYFQQKTVHEEAEAQREAENRRMCIGLAINALNSESDASVTLRPWAADVLQEYLPVKLTEDAMTKLKSGEAGFTYRDYPVYNEHYAAPAKKTAKRPDENDKK